MTGIGTDWSSRARALVMPDGHHIEGAVARKPDAQYFETHNPATGSCLARLPVGTREDMDSAVRAARAAFEDGRWRLLPLSARKAVLQKAAQLVDANREEFALIEALEVGKAISNALSEIDISIDWLRYYAEAIDKLYGDVAPTDGDLWAFSMFEPRGVVGAIVPWNFPLANTVIKAAPALAAGNSVVLKPSEIASLSALRFAQILVEAGMPAGVFNVVLGLGSTGDALARHPDVDFLSFTGSSTTGRALMRASGESNGKPLMLECGGKSPQIICADMKADVEVLAAKIVRDGFWNQGQWCSARTRLIVEEPLYEQVIEAVTEEARTLVPGEPLDPNTTFGTISSESQFGRIRDLVALGKKQGARAVLDGPVGKPCKLSHAPTIFADVHPSMSIAREEIFGPVLSVMKASDFSDAIAKANDTVYGLSATIWTQDLQQARHAVRELRAGRTVVRTNPLAVGSSSIALGAEPCRESGFGVEKGIDGLKAYCRIRAVEIL